MVNVWKERNKDVKESYLIRLARIFSFPFTYILFKMGVPPTAITLTSFLLKILGGVFIALNGFSMNYNPVNNIFAGIFIYLSLIFDNCDGEVARLSNKTSIYGEWIDGAFDRIGDLFVLISVSFNALNHTAYFNITLLGAFLAVPSTTMWRYMTLHTKVKFGETIESSKRYKPFGFDKGFMYTLIALGVLFNQLLYVMWFFAIIVNLAWIKRVSLDAFKRS